MTTFLHFVLALALGLESPGRPAAAAPTPAAGDAAARAPSPTPQVARREDKTLVVALDVFQGEGKDRVSLYRDGTLALVRTYAGVRTVKKKVLSEEEVDLIARVCSEANSLSVAEYRVEVLGQGEPRRFRLEIGRPGADPRVFLFDELARVPLVLGRARGALEELLQRFDENVVSEDDLWNPAALKIGDVLTSRTDGKRYRIVSDDSFVRSLEMVEVERSLQRLVIVREDVPKLFRDPASDEGGPRR